MVIDANGHYVHKVDHFKNFPLSLLFIPLPIVTPKLPPKNVQIFSNFKEIGRLGIKLHFYDFSEGGRVRERVK